MSSNTDVSEYCIGKLLCIIQIIVVYYFWIKSFFHIMLSLTYLNSEIYSRKKFRYI